MNQFVFVLLFICIAVSLRPCCSLLKNADGSFPMNSLNAVLLNCPTDHREWLCEPQLFVTVNFKANMNVQNQHKLLIIDKIYDPTKRQIFKTMAPYVIIISRSEPIVMHPLLLSNLPHLTEHCSTLACSNCNTKIINSKSKRQDKYDESYVNDGTRLTTAEMEINFNTYANKKKDNNGKIHIIPSPNYVYKISNIQNNDQFEKNDLIDDNCGKKNKHNILKRNSSIRPILMNIIDKVKRSKQCHIACRQNSKTTPNTNDKQQKINSVAQKKCCPRAYSAYNLSAPFSYLVAKIRIFKKRKQKWWMIMPSITLNNLSGTFVNENISILLTAHEDILQPKKTIFQGNHTFFIPTNFLNHIKNIDAFQMDRKNMLYVFNKSLNNTFSFENSKNNPNKEGSEIILITNLTKNAIEKINTKSGDELILASNKTISKCPIDNETFCFNMINERVPALSIKIKMSFRENAVQQNIPKVKVSRIITDATTKDALQISVDVVNKGLESKEYLITISNCPLSETESVRTTVKKMIFPYISETITFLLPFIMGSMKNVKFTCDLIVKANTINPLKETKLNASTSLDSNIIVISKRSFEIETHSRCFCIWNCRCHCIGKIETHIDISVCQQMTFAAEKDAGLLLNCPPNGDSNDFCLMDPMNEKTHLKINEAFGTLCKIVGVLLIVMLILLMVCFWCKCFTPRKEDLIVASTEWICNPEGSLGSQSKEDDTISLCTDEKKYSTKRDFINSGDFSINKASGVTLKNNNKTDLLESAFVTLTRQQQGIRNQLIKKD